MELGKITLKINQKIIMSSDIDEERNARDIHKFIHMAKGCPTGWVLSDSKNDIKDNLMQFECFTENNHKHRHDIRYHLQNLRNEFSEVKIIGDIENSENIEFQIGGGFNE